jgi:hypothetical protein
MPLAGHRTQDDQEAWASQAAGDQNGVAQNNARPNRENRRVDFAGRSADVSNQPGPGSRGREGRCSAPLQGGIATLRKGLAADPNVWSGRALQENSSTWRMFGLASMYPAFCWSVELRATMDISARAFSLPVRPRPGHSSLQGSHAPGRPILHLISLSRRPRQVKVRCYVMVLLVESLSSFLMAFLRRAHADWGEGTGILTTSKFRSLLRTAQAMRASLLASAIANTL